MRSDDLDAAVVDTWLQPLPDADKPCGKDFEYENEFLELVKSAEGKPETQFAPGEPANWRDVHELSTALLSKTRDLRVAILWVRSSIHLHGLAALPLGIRLVEGLLENFWDQLHPLPDPDDGDQFARVNALALLPLSEGLLGDLRQCFFFQIRGVGELRLRAVEIALGLLSARPDEATLTKEQIAQMILSALDQSPELGDLPQSALTRLKALGVLMNERFGISSAPELRPIVDLIKGLDALLPTPSVKEARDASGEDPSFAALPKVALTGVVNSREDAVRAIDMICEYLEKAEPSNPAQLMLRRARRLLNQNFLQLMKELAPDSLNEVARVMGVDPESISSGS